MKTRSLVLSVLCSFVLSAAVAQPYQPALVKDICNTGSSTPGSMYRLGSKVLFRADDCIHGSEWWITDGTSAGTELLKDIFPGATGSVGLYSGDVAVFNNKLFFCASDSVHGFELWVTDGTSAGTQMVKDINPGIGRTYMAGMWEANGKLYFNRSKGSGGTDPNEIWTTDGTAAGTVLFKDLDNYAQTIAYNGKMYLSARNALGYEMWISDGTDTGTKLLKDINPGAAGSGPGLFTVFNGYLYFKAEIGTKYQIWRTDGTDTGTKQFTNIASTETYGLNPMSMVAYNNHLYFNGNDSISFTALYKSDGTVAGTKKICELSPIYTNTFDTFDHKLFFPSRHLGNGIELCYVDANDTVRRITDIRAGSGDSNPYYFRSYNNKLFFTASPSGGTRHLYYTDGSDTGTHQVTLLPGYSGNTITNPGMILLDTLLLYSGTYNSTMAMELYKLTGYSNPTTVTPNAPHSGTAMKVYPNPAREQVHIALPEKLDKTAVLHVYDVTGKAVIEQSVTSGKEAIVHVRDLPAGMYYLRMLQYRASFIKQ